MKKKIIIPILIISILLITYIIMNLFGINQEDKLCVHKDQNSDKLCDTCKEYLPFDKFVEFEKLEVKSEDNTTIKITGSMPENTKATVNKISEKEAYKVAKKFAKASQEDVLYGYDLSLSAKEYEYQPGEYSNTVTVELSDVSIDLDKHYAMLHVIGGKNYELLPIRKLSNNKISFDATRFSSYILITVEGQDVSFEGSNYNIYDMDGNKLTNGTTIASGTNFKFNIVPEAGYGIQTVSSTSNNFSMTNTNENEKTCTLSSVTEAITINVTTMAAPTITAHPVTTKIQLGKTASFSVVVSGSANYRWQYKTSHDVEEWINVTSDLGTAVNVANGYNTSTLTIDTSKLVLDNENLTVANDLSGYLFRCLVIDTANSTVMSKSDSAMLITSQNEILDNVNIISESTLEVQEAEIIEVGDNANIPFEYVGDSTVSIESSDETIASATLNGNTVSVNAIKPGTVKLTLSAPATSAYAPVSKEVNVTVIQTGEELVTEWNIPQNTTIELPIPQAENNSYTVNWGDGTTEYFDSTADFPSHQYTTANTYTIKIVGTLSQFGYVDEGLPTETNIYSKYYDFTQYVTKLVDWGEVGAQRYGFAYCTNLSGEIPALRENTFENIVGLQYLFYNCTNISEVPEDIIENVLDLIETSNTDIFFKTFAGCMGITTLSIDTKYIGTQMFYGCNNLTNITIGNNVETIYMNAFYADEPYNVLNPLLTTINSSNEITLNYNWFGDNRTDIKSITVQPSDVTTNVFEEVTFTVAAEGSNIEYQWYEISDGKLIKLIEYGDHGYEGVNTNTLTIPAEKVVESMNGNKYFCEAYNSFGGVDSRQASLTTINIPLTNVNATNYEGVYDGKPHGINMTGEGINGANIIYGTKNGEYVLEQEPTYIDAGTYTVYFKIEKENYEDFYGSAQIVIEPKPVKVVLNQDKLQYDGSLQKPTVSVDTGIEGEKITAVVVGGGINVGFHKANVRIESVEGGQGNVNNYKLVVDEN